MSEITIKELEKLIIKTNDLNGFSWKENEKNCPYIVLAKFALIHTEVTELEKASGIDYVLEEMADIIIRTLDMTGRLIDHMGIKRIQNGGYTDLSSCFGGRGVHPITIEGLVKYTTPTPHQSNQTSYRTRLTWIRNDIDNAIEDYRRESPWFMFHVGDIIYQVVKAFHAYRFEQFSQIDITPEKAIHDKDLLLAILDKMEKNQNREYMHGKLL